jgi:hypothetical protein
MMVLGSVAVVIYLLFNVYCTLNFVWANKQSLFVPIAVLTMANFVFSAYIINDYLSNANFLSVLLFIVLACVCTYLYFAYIKKGLENHNSRNTDAELAHTLKGPTKRPTSKRYISLGLLSLISTSMLALLVIINRANLLKGVRSFPKASLYVIAFSVFLLAIVVFSGKFNKNGS